MYTRLRFVHTSKIIHNLQTFCLLTGVSERQLCQTCLATQDCSFVMCICTVVWVGCVICHVVSYITLCHTSCCVIRHIVSYVMLCHTSHCVIHHVVSYVTLCHMSCCVICHVCVRSEANDMALRIAREVTGGTVVIALQQLVDSCYTHPFTPLAICLTSVPITSPLLLHSVPTTGTLAHFLLSAP